MVRNTQEIAAALQAALDKQGKSERWLHEQTGIPRTTLRGELSGARAMKLQHYLLIAEALELDPVDLLDRATSRTNIAA